jgi:hypothetical protein
MSRKDSVTLEDRLAREIKGDVFFDAFNRGRYATDASFYHKRTLPRSKSSAI